MNLVKHWAGRLDDYAIDLAWSPSGQMLAAASSAGPIRLFAAETGALLHELPGHEDGTNTIAFQPQVERVVPNALVPNTLPQVERLVPNRLPEVGRRVPAPPSPVPILSSGGQDGTVKFWDAASGQHTATAALGTAWVEHLAWGLDPGGAPILAASAGRKLAFLNPDGSLRHAYPDTAKTISALAWKPSSPDAPPKPECTLAIAFFGAVRLIAGQDFGLHKEFLYANGIQALVWSPDAKWLVSGNHDPSVHLWIPGTDVELQMSGYESKVRHLSFDSSSRWLATGGGREACVWDCSGDGPEGREPAMLPHDTPVSALAFQNSHGLLASASQGGEVHLWSPERRQPLRASVKLPDGVTKLAWTPDDRMLAIGSETGIIYVLICEA